MAITEDQYKQIAQHIKANCDPLQIRSILNGDFTPLKNLITDELMMIDYQGTLLDIIYEDLWTQKKKPYLRKASGDFAEFLMSDLSLGYVRYHLAKLKK